jgi:hypothetical protein
MNSKLRAFIIPIICFFFFINVNNSISQDTKTTKPQKQKTALKILLAGIEVGKEMKNVTPSKVEAAFAFSMLMGQFFDIIPPKYADSISAQLSKEGKENSILALANHFSADYIAYINVNRFKNILRTDITLLSGKEFKNKSTGTGYAFVNYRDSIDEKLLYDPSITLSIQRSFAIAVKDSLLYAKLANPVFPARSLVISGIEFRNNPEYYKWNLFTNEVENSYFLLESIFHSASKSKYYIVFDFDSRDAIYSSFKFYSPENYKAPNQMELYALRQFEVQTFITGSFTRFDGGAELILVHQEFSNEGLTVINRVRGVLETDSKVELEKFVEKLTKELLKIEE